VFWKFNDKPGETEEEDEQDLKKRGPLVRGYNAFNADQVDGFTLPELPILPAAERMQSADRFFTGLNADIRNGGARAFYSPAGDFIQMPPFEIFKEPTAYYATLAHESVHWVGGSQRLNRDLKGRFGTEAYAAEELVAELGAAFLCADLGLSSEPRPDHAAYVQNWLKVLRNDTRAIFTASSRAQAAADWLHSLQPVAASPALAAS
jgi:antirestriction protein ArdC